MERKGGNEGREGGREVDKKEELGRNGGREEG